jgi:hypothetical protein
VTQSDLRLVDLSGHQVPSKLMNVMIPAGTADAIDELVDRLGCSKTAAVVALLNEGLEVFDRRRDELTVNASATRRPRRGRPPTPVAKTKSAKKK